MDALNFIERHALEKAERPAGAMFHKKNRNGDADDRRDHHKTDQPAKEELGAGAQGDKRDDAK